MEVGQTAKSGHRTTSAVKQLKRGSKGSNSIAAVSKQKAVVDATAAADAKQSVVLNTDRAFLHIGEFK